MEVLEGATDEAMQQRAALDEQAEKLLGHYAQVVNLVGRKSHNGSVVFLEKWDREKQVYEARLRKGYMVLKLPFANQQLVDETTLDDEQEPDLGEIEVAKQNIPYEADGQTKTINKLPHMQTTSGQWRKVDD